jgi:hypothetical protein
MYTKSRLTLLNVHFYLYIGDSSIFNSNLLYYNKGILSYLRLGHFLDNWSFQACSFLAWSHSKNVVPVLVAPGLVVPGLVVPASVGVPTDRSGTHRQGTILRMRHFTVHNDLP